MFEGPIVYKLNTPRLCLDGPQVKTRKLFPYLGLRIPSNEQIHNMHSSNIMTNIFSRKLSNINLILKRLLEYIYTGWGGQLWAKMFFFQSIGLHVGLTVAAE